jgi:hypothetical protein
VGIAVAVAVALFFVLRDDGDDDGEPATAPVVTEQPGDGQAGGGEPEQPEPEPKPKVAEIVVKGGEPVGGVAELEFDRGERIQFVVRSDVADHVHLHGYDVFMDIAAGGRVEFDVPATHDGVYEVELEDRVVPLAEITVNPG